MNYSPAMDEAMQFVLPQLLRAQQAQQPQPQPNQITPGLPGAQPQGQPQPMAAPGARPAPSAMGAPSGGVNPETAAAMLALRGGTEASDADRSKALATRLRADAKGQLQGRDTGKFYVGPSWLNMAANVLENQKANQADAAGGKSETTAAQKRERAAQRMFEALRRQGASEDANAYPE